jgi:hypothetical protein
MPAFAAYTGKVTAIENVRLDAETPSGCVKMMSILTAEGGIINFIVDPSTYFVSGVIIIVGDVITGFYDPNLPTIMIYPPQYRALVIARYSRAQSVLVDHFDENLISSDGNIQLSIANSTRLSLTNRQPFWGRLENRDLVVIYGNYSPYQPRMPLRISPWHIIVLC